MAKLGGADHQADHERRSNFPFPVHTGNKVNPCDTNIVELADNRKYEIDMRRGLLSLEQKQL